MKELIGCEWKHAAKDKIVTNKNSSTLKIKGMKKGKSTLKIRVNGVKVLPLTVVVK